MSEYQNKRDARNMAWLIDTILNRDGNDTELAERVLYLIESSHREITNRNTLNLMGTALVNIGNSLLDSANNHDIRFRSDDEDKNRQATRHANISPSDGRKVIL